MLQILRTDASHPDFIALVRLLDADLAHRDGEDHAFYAQFNQLQSIRQAVVAYLDGSPVGCGAIKEFQGGAMEVKRMFVHPDWRGRGIAGRVLQELEDWASELGKERCVLETGKRQPEAIALYTKCGYRLIPNFGPYEGDENSVCMEKVLPSQLGA